MGYIPPNENGSPTPTPNTAYKPVRMPVRGAPNPPVKQQPVQMPLKGSSRDQIGANRLRYLGAKKTMMNKKMNYAAAARKRLAGG